MKKRLLSLFLSLCILVGLMAAMPVSACAASITFPKTDVSVSVGETIAPSFSISEDTMVYKYYVVDSSNSTVARQEFAYRDCQDPSYESFSLPSPGRYTIFWEVGGYDLVYIRGSYIEKPNNRGCETYCQNITVTEDSGNGDNDDGNDPDKTYTVDFHISHQYDGGLFNSWNQAKVKVNHKVKFPSLPGMPEHLELVGWYTDRELTKAFDPNTPIREDMSLYGKLKERTYTIYFDTRGGNAVDPITFGYKDKVVLPEASRAGYVFGGWYSNYDVTEVYEVGKVKSDHTIYAKWLANEYKVRFETNCGVNVEDQNVRYGDTVELPEEPQRDNYMFAGWYTDRELTEAYDFAKAVESNFTLYAKWTANPFEDVNTADYFFKPVLWAVDKGVTTGLSETAFGPGSPCTRAQVVTFLWRAAGKPAADGENPFDDVKRDAYYYDAVIWAVNKGITTGLSETSFGPNEKCTRGQIVTFLWRAQGKNVADAANPFEDVSSEAYFYDAVLWAVDKGVTTGLSATSFGPNSTCTRGQIVTFLYRAMS